jgi:signal transduction histidine kinase
MMHSPIVRAWAPDVAIGLVILLLGFWEAYTNAYSGYSGGSVTLVVAFGTALAVALVRHAGWWSFGILWVLLVLQAATTTDLMVVELAVVGVAFGLARWGSRPLLWASGLSIPIATFFAISYVGILANGLWGTRVLRNLIVPLVDSGISWPLVVLPMIAGVLALPWFAGLAARYWGAARVSQRSQSEAEAEALSAQLERARMTEIASLREGQARLARDVHDVVGHSLTVILAQAESAQFLDSADPAALKRTMANIAATARTSLQEVRGVLASPDGDPEHRTDLDTLIDTTRASGNEIIVTDLGSPRPLPPELATVAFRVLQEMLTNALKHGRRDGAIAVTRQWDDRLRLTVTNHADVAAAAGAEVADKADGADGADGVGTGAVEAADTTGATDAAAVVDVADVARGSGIAGMRRRLESVGGALEVRDNTADTSVFTITAELPVRAGRSLETVLP